MIADSYGPLVIMLGTPSWASEIFPEPLNYCHVMGTRDIQIASDFVVNSKTLGRIVVPKGYISDGASVPRLFWNIFPPFGTYLEAAVPHDLVYSDLFRMYTKEQADMLFRELLIVLRVPKWKVSVMYRGVKYGGKGGW